MQLESERLKCKIETMNQLKDRLPCDLAQRDTVSNVKVDMGFHIIDSHPFHIVLSASSSTHPHILLSQNAHQRIPPSTAPVWDLNSVLRTSETQQNMPGLCHLPTWGRDTDSN
eukprot:12522774-Ditylum_brightwellii.AAC.1